MPVDRSHRRVGRGGGHLECLKYLREHEKEWCEPTIMFADGQDNGLWNAEVLAKAARGGHLECLKYLRDECGCAWDARTSRGGGVGRPRGSPELGGV